MTSTTPRPPGRETSGHTGAGLIGSLDTGIDAGPDGQALKDRARERDMRQGSDAGDEPGDGGHAASLGDLSQRDDTAAGLSDVSGPGQMAGRSGGERAVAGRNDADRSSKDDRSSLDR